MAIFLLEFQAFDETIPGEVTIRLSTGKGFLTGKTETPSFAVYLPLIINVGSIDTFLFQNAKITGVSISGRGNIVLNNKAGDLDFLKDFGLDGRDFVIRENDGNGTAYPANFPIRFPGTIKTATFSDAKLTLGARNRLEQVFTAPYQDIKYAGTNDGATIFVEGTEDDIGGTPKPLRRGVVQNFEPILVNKALEMYQISADEIFSLDNVYEGRAIPDAQTQFTSLADLISSNPPSAKYNFYLGDDSLAKDDVERGAYFRLGSTPSFPITCDITEGATAADRTAGQILSRMFTYAGATLNASSVATLDVDVDFQVQHSQSNSEITFDKVVTSVASSVSAFITDDLNGEFIVGQFQLPTVPEVVLDIDPSTLLGVPKIKEIVSRDKPRGIPIHKINLGYSQNYTVMANNQLTGIGEADITFVSEEFRVVTDEDLTIIEEFLTSPEFNIDTRIVLESEAQTQATFIFNLLNFKASLIQIRIPIEFGRDLNLDDVIRLEGKVYRIIGKLYKFPRSAQGGSNTESGNAITFQAWGGIDG